MLNYISFDRVSDKKLSMKTRQFKLKNNYIHMECNYLPMPWLETLLKLSMDNYTPCKMDAIYTLVNLR